LADTKVKTAEDYMAEIAEMAKKIEELEAALKNKKVEAAEKETYTKEEAEKMAEEKAEAAVKLAEERAKRNMELAEVTRDIVPAIGNTIKAAYTEPKDGVLELAEGVSVAPKDAVLKIVDAIVKHETKTSAPIVMTKSIKASYPDLNKDTQENEDAEVAADVKRIEEASR
jgi:vacuolar-type H+-ATPase subunit I/STV1